MYLGDPEHLNDLLLESVPLKKRKRLSNQLMSNTEDMSAVDKLESGQANWWEVDLKGRLEEEILLPDVVNHNEGNSSTDVNLLAVKPDLSAVIGLNMEDTPANR